MVMGTFYSHNLGKTIQRIDKRKARKLYEQGVTVYLQSSNMAFDSVWQSAFSFDKTDDIGFDNLCNHFRYYNCDSERGRYIHYFVAADVA